MAALGTVVAINGTTDAVKNVIVVTESGVKRPLHLGDTIQPGDTIITPNGVIVELQLQNGKVMQVFAEQLVKFTPEFADAIPPSSGDSAVDQATIQAVIKAINEGRDIGEVLEETAAGLSGGGSTVYGFDIVNLLRIVEQLNPVAFQFESGRIEIPEINFAFADPNQGAFSGAPATPPVDNLPVAVNDTVNATEDAVFNGNLAANDTSSADGGNVWALGTGATHGTVIINANGTFSYTPNANYNGPDSFTYTITDADGDISTATVTVNVAAVNDIPVANPDVASTPINTAINNINVKANDIDADGDTLIVSSPVLATPALGTVTLNPDGTINFVPAPTTTGPVIINYTLSDNNGGTSVGTLTVNVGNNTPPTGANNTFTFDEDTSKTFATSDFGFNDVDLGQTLLTVRIDSLPSAGSLKLNGTDVIAGQIILQTQLGNLVFTPAPNANGANYASFTFSVQDNLGAFDTTPNTITLNVTPVNDAPVLSFSNTIASLTEGTATVGMTITDANATDEDGDTLSYSLVAGSDPNGYYAINASTGLVTLTAAGVAHVNAGGDLPTVQVQVSDGTTSVSGSQALPTTTDVNDAPVNTVPGTLTTNEDVALAISGLSVTDEDAGSGSMTVTLAVTNGILNVSGGTAAISGSGTGTVTLTGTAVQINATLAATVNYVPTSNYSGGATFTMTTNDNGNSGAGGPLSDTDAVAINVTAVADAPLVYVLPQVFGVNASLAAANVSTGTGTTQATIETTLGLTGGILDTYDPAANPGLGTNDPGTIDATTGGFVNQNVSIQTGQQVAIGWSFTNTENLTDINAGYNDFLVLVVTNPSGGKTYTLISSAEATGAGPATLSGTYNFTATTAGDYQFSWVVMNGRDTQVQSTMTINAPKYVIGGTNYAPPVYIPIAANLVDTDGSESLSYTITGVPTGATFSAGTSLGGGVWSFTPAQVAGLHIYPADGYTGIMNLTLNVTSTEASNGATAVTSQAFTVEVSGTTASQYGTNANNTLTGTAGNDLLEGFAGNDTIAGAAGNDVIYGDAGTDILDGGANNDVLYGGAGNDTLTGGTGQDRLVGGAGNDTMQGGSGSDDGNMDVFQWSLADAGTAGAPAVDTINFFGTAAATAGGDVLDIRDLLSGESRDAAVLDNYLHFQFSGGNTTVYISSSGAFGDGNTVGAPSGTVTANSVQNIVLNGVDLIGGSTTDMQVIQNLLNNNKLITD